MEWLYRHYKGIPSLIQFTIFREHCLKRARLDGVFLDHTGKAWKELLSLDQRSIADRLSFWKGEWE